jgi:hypothetical protein
VCGVTKTLQVPRNASSGLAVCNGCKVLHKIKYKEVGTKQLSSKPQRALEIKYQCSV